MPAIDSELQALRENLLDMLSMVRAQLEKCIQAIEENDTTIAAQVKDDEKKVNIQELAIDRDCENILALHTPVATDLRLVIATLKIANDLERIGDSAKSLAKVISEDLTKKEYKWIESLGIVQMLTVLVDMLKEMGNAIKKSDTKPALKAAAKDEELNSYFKKALKTTGDLILKNPDDAKTILTLLLMVRNLERSGDLTKNIAEDIVFQIEAKVVKHKKARK
ncbi:MAG TPA: phosphate signaling complex protein PhoU [Chryseosolibacter sp.]|nr:phosphate signaling complex protein PhoU [Chryseosolibacter sp.]